MPEQNSHQLAYAIMNKFLERILFDFDSDLVTICSCVKQKAIVRTSLDRPCRRHFTPLIALSKNAMYVLFGYIVRNGTDSLAG